MSDSSAEAEAVKGAQGSNSAETETVFNPSYRRQKEDERFALSGADYLRMEEEESKADSAADRLLLQDATTSPSI
jgi:hypothetical protein